MEQGTVSAEWYEVEPIGVLLDSVEEKTGDDIPNKTSSTVDNGAGLFST